MINLTPHAIVFQHVDGSRTTIEPSGTIARVSTMETLTGEMIAGIPVVTRSTGEVTGLPTDGTPCIVSGMVLSSVPGRTHTYAPDTGSTAIRNDVGHIVAVTRMVAA